MLIKRVGAARWRYLQVLQVGQRCQSGRSQVTDIVVTQVPEQNRKEREKSGISIDAARAVCSAQHGQHS